MTNQRHIPRPHLCIDRSGFYRMIARNWQHRHSLAKKPQPANEGRRTGLDWIGINKWSNNYQLIWLSSGQWLPRTEHSDSDRLGASTSSPRILSVPWIHCLERCPDVAWSDKINFHDPLQEFSLDSTTASQSQKSSISVLLNGSTRHTGDGWC